MDAKIKKNCNIIIFLLSPTPGQKSEKNFVPGGLPKKTKKKKKWKKVGVQKNLYIGGVKKFLWKKFFF